MKTYVEKAGGRHRRWQVVDAEGKTLGRLATRLATMLRGKDKPEFTPHADMGDFVVVVNASKVHMTGKKSSEKMYYRHSGYPGGLKSVSAETLSQTKPEEIIRKAVWGMLPKNKSQKKLIKRLKVYSGQSHPHAAQSPEAAAGL
ncbi:MAG: 50S ribosomal protein L13 [Candidatus Dadabacteria bacterium]|nr:50S ribosomal protein L13 [Candidatus Dadabacteria bacterium]MCY4042202.1 50S ribosomal protein L13 [Candidatus Dadabacteria bacterium]MCY4047561.1 50S ribosomal protein L13 [Candidatus Dadabacteria bacterium]